MEIITKNLQTLVPGRAVNFEWRRWLNENVTGSVWQTIWLLAFGAFVAWFTGRQLNAAPVPTIIVLVLWALTVYMTSNAEFKKQHTNFTNWLTHNLYNSITNVLVTLFLVLVILAAIRGFYTYAYVNASFQDDPITSNEERTEVPIDEVDRNLSGLSVGRPFEVPSLRNAAGTVIRTTTYTVLDEERTTVEVLEQEIHTGATWGSVIDNFGNLVVFRFRNTVTDPTSREEVEIFWRLRLVFYMLAVLVGPSIIVYGIESWRERGSQIFLAVMWAISFAILVFLLYLLQQGGGLNLVQDLIFAAIGLGLIFGITALPKRMASILTNIAWVVFFFLVIGLLRGYEPDGPIVLSQIAIVIVIFAAGYGLTTFMNRLENSVLPTFSPIVWLITIALGLFFLRGSGILPDGLASTSGPFYPIDPDQIWGGLLLTLMITIFSVVVSFPLGVLLALGRRSEIQGIPWWVTYPLAAIATVWLLINQTPTNLEEARSSLGTVLAFWPVLIPVAAYLFQRFFKGNVVAAFCTIYIEVVRGVPLITVLFMAIILFPIFLPEDVSFANTVRVFGAFTLFTAAYLAENVRGGLQSLSKGQYEAADSLGLSVFDKYRLIILPQALRAVIPAIVGMFISVWKDTSLVYLVGLFDVLQLANVISTQPEWLGIRTEPYILLLVIYFIGSAAMAGYSRRLERQLGVGER